VEKSLDIPINQNVANEVESLTVGHYDGLPVIGDPHADEGEAGSSSLCSNLPSRAMASRGFKA
jgi:hypothetical protein